jgi:hypothetical protein
MEDDAKIFYLDDFQSSPVQLSKLLLVLVSTVVLSFLIFGLLFDERGGG